MCILGINYRRISSNFHDKDHHWKHSACVQFWIFLEEYIICILDYLQKQYMLAKNTVLNLLQVSTGIMKYLYRWILIL